MAMTQCAILALTAFFTLFRTSSSVRPSGTSAVTDEVGVESHVKYGGEVTYNGRKAVMWLGGPALRIDLEQPSEGEYNLDEPRRTYYSQWQQDRKLFEPLLGGIDDLRRTRDYKPFFVESGALEGERDSNSLFLEKSRNWQGLLVEPSDQNFPHLHQKGRKAWAFHGALSPTSGSAQLEFTDKGNGLSGASGVVKTSDPSQKIITQAEPLTALLQKIQSSAPLVVDFWSLDIEGSEGAVLESTDFNKVQVGVLMIEMNKGDENNVRIRKVMQANGFQEIGGTTYDQSGSLDRVFVNPTYFEERKLKVPEHFGMV